MKKYIIIFILLCIFSLTSTKSHASLKWVAYTTSYKEGNGNWSESYSCYIPIIIVDDYRGRKLLNICYDDNNIETFLIQEKKKDKDGRINLICKNIVTNEPAFFLFTATKNTIYLFMQTTTDFCVSFELKKQE